MVKFKMGDVISECYPFAHCVASGDKDRRCHYCLAIKPLKKCSKCQIARYCSSDCQAQDWKNVHQSECKVFKKDSSSANPILLKDDFTRLVLRCQLILNKYPEKANELIDTYNGPKSFSSLKSCVEHIFGESSMKSIIGYRMGDIFKSLGVPIKIEEYLEIFGKVMINFNSLADVSLVPYGVGLYIGRTVFDHSCMPNACTLFDGFKMRIRAMKDFDSGQEPPVISIINNSLSVHDRQDLVREHFFFTCKCPRCLNPDDHQQEVKFRQQQIKFLAFVVKEASPDCALVE